MNTVVDILILVFIVLGTYAGARKGLLKTLVNLVGLIAVVVLSFSLRIPLANFLIDKMPFLPFAGSWQGLGTINILFYNVVAFVIIFILLYCVLNIILSLTGFIDTLLKFTVIWVIPSKIGGAILGFIEAWLFIFLAIFVLSQFSILSTYINESKAADIILNNTPFIGSVIGSPAKAAQEINNEIKEFLKQDEKSYDDMNIKILQTLIKYNIISKEKVNELIEDEKINLKNTYFASEDNLWLNI